MTVSLSKIARPERVTLGDTAYLKLKNLLISGELKPDEKLSLRSVAEALGVSIMPVREATARLVADGALTVLPNRAVSVPLMTAQKLLELTEVRVAVEGFASELAALKRTDAQLRQIVAIDKRFRRAVRAPAPTVSDALLLNKELHFSIYSAAGLAPLVPIIEGLWLKIGPIINLDLGATQRLGTGVAERHHARWVAAIASRNSAEARAALADDIRTSAEFIISNGSLPP